MRETPEVLRGRTPYDLRPPGMEELGLIQVLYQYCKDFSEKTGLNVNFKSAGFSKLKINFDIEINLYRLVQEGLNNINRHAEAKKVLHRVPALENWASLGTKKEFIVPGCFEANRDALLASDPKSGELGGVIRVPGGRTVDEDLSDPYFDASKITVPTLVIRGSADTWAKGEDNKQLVDALGSTVKKYVEIPGGGHYLHFEKVNMQFYKAVRGFLESEN